MQAMPLPSQEADQNQGYNFLAVITADDLTKTATNTAQTFNLFPLAIGDSVKYVTGFVKTAFQNSADAAFNTDTYSVGDTANGATQYIGATEMNANGTVVTQKESAATAAFIYTATDNLLLTVNSQSGKALNNLNKGELHIYAKIWRAAKADAAKQALPILNK